MILYISKLIYLINDKNIPVEVIRLIRSYIPRDMYSLSVIGLGTNEIVLRPRI